MKVRTEGRTLWFDMDGVLADFDEGARRILETDNSYKWEFVHGTKAFWDKLDGDDEFFLSLPMMKDAVDLLFAGVQTGMTLKVLTALPKTGADRVKSQKEAWIELNVGDVVSEVVTCLTHEKPDYCRPGDILIDDRNVNAAAWVKAGGIYILHTSAADTTRQLRDLGVL